jgi:hypothetical protein
VTIQTGVARAGTQTGRQIFEKIPHPLNTGGADAVFGDALEDTFSPR